MRPNMRGHGCGDVAETSGSDQLAQPAPHMRRPIPFGPHRCSNDSGHSVVTNIDVQSRPISVDESDASAWPQDSCHLVDGHPRIGDPLQRALRPHRVEGSGSGSSTAIASPIEKRTGHDGGGGVLPSDGQHCTAGVDAYHLARGTQVGR